MISNQVLQNTIDGVKKISRIEVAILDIEGKELASTLDVDYVFGELIESFVSSPADSQVVQGFQFFKIFDEHSLEYIAVAKGSSEDVYMVGKLIAFQLQSLIVAYKERYDKDNFIKNLLLDNLLLVDIYNRAKKLHIEPATRRAVFIVESSVEKNQEFYDNIKAAFANSGRDFVTNLEEDKYVYIKELITGDQKELDLVAKSLQTFMRNEYNEDPVVSYGNTVSDLKHISKSYKEAKMSLDVGKIFYEEKKLIPYSKLGIGRLIYQLPISLCKMFIKEIFVKRTPDKFDEETLITIDKFFENSLNVSETARQLYIHRNTLVYRLDKLKKNSGIDLRSFDEAITFKIGLMVFKYMAYIEKNTGKLWR